MFQTHIDQLQERIRSLQSDKSDSQKQLSTVSAQLVETDASRSALAVEVEGMKRALDGVKRQLASKDQESEEQIERVKQDFKKR